MLQLFVAKRDGVWLYKAQAEAGLAETSGLEPLDGRQSSLQCMGWSGNDLAELDEQTQVDLLHVLVTVPQKEQIFPTYRLYSGGINVRLPHLPRAVFVERLLATVLMADFVLLSSPPAFGKTSLLALFHERCWASYHCEAVSLNHLDSAGDILLRIGIDISNQTCSLGINGASIVMLDDAPQPNEVLPFCLSDTMAQKIGRLYVKKDPVPSSTELQSFLIKCLLEDSMPLPMHGDDRICFERLKMAGIIAQYANSFVRFASPMAKRYYSKYLFPNRGHPNPSSLSDFITKVIGKMSASVLKKSTVGKKDFPKEATFQHQLMAGIAAVT